MKYITVFLFVLSLVACKDATKTYSSIPEDVTGVMTQNNELHPGKIVLENQCYICHNPEASESTMIAPPMIAVKKHYISVETTKEEFTAALVNWINDPQQEKSKMPGALRKFGIMPYQPHSEETIRDIADYMYDNEIPQPAWFEEHFQKGHGKGMMGKGMGKGKGKGKGMGKSQGEMKNMQSAYEEVPAIYSEKGMEYAMGTQAILGKNLLKAIQKTGTEGAISFCKEAAIPLTDSMATVKNTIIKRVSDKPRNLSNAASREETGYIAAFKAQLATGSDIRPITKRVNDLVYFYYPITTNAKCLQCHGVKERDIEPSVLTVLSQQYPEDKATGYNVNEVRGMWRVQFIEE